MSKNNKKDTEQCTLHGVIKRYCVKFICYGNINLEYVWVCDAENENKAQKHFEAEHDMTIHDILDINVLQLKAMKRAIACFTSDS